MYDQSTEHKTDEKILEAQRKYYAKEEVKQRKKEQSKKAYENKKKRELPKKVNKYLTQILNDMKHYTEEEKQHFYENCKFVITQK
jgi:hypothetical protein